MNTTDRKQPTFLMLQIEDLKNIAVLLGQGTLLPRDMAVCLVLLSRTTTFSGRISVTAQAIADELRCNETDVRKTIGRLKRHHLLRQIKDPNTGVRYYRLNPSIVSTTKGSSWGLALKEFADA
jgi:predicted transcriptional regulator